MSKDTLKRLLIASIQSNPVFKRFAQLSEEDKAKVIEKVKEKIKNKGKGEGDESADTDEKPEGGESADTDENSDEGADTAEKPDAETDAVEKPEEGADTAEKPEDDTAEEPEGDAGIDEEPDTDEEPEDEAGDTEGEDAEAEDSGDAADGIETVVDAKPPEDKESDTPETSDDSVEGTPEGVVEDENSPELTSIVDGITQEIKTIKEDGRVTPSEVMGLMDGMMKMVVELLRAKPGRNRKAAIVDRLCREAKIARNIEAGYSYAVEILILEVEGWQPINIDVLRDISRVWFPAKDDEGHDIDANMTSLRYEKVSPRGYLTYQQEQMMKQRGESPIQSLQGQIPEGSEKEAVKAIGRVLSRFKLRITKATVR